MNNKIFNKIKMYNCLIIINQFTWKKSLNPIDKHKNWKFKIFYKIIIRINKSKIKIIHKNAIIIYKPQQIASENRKFRLYKHKKKIKI